MSVKIYLFFSHSNEIEVPWFQKVASLEMIRRFLTPRSPSPLGRRIIYDQGMNFLPPQINWKANFLTFFTVEEGSVDP